jgi:hypothetical protein
MFPKPVPGQSQRDKFVQHEKDPVCGSCHRLMDSFGLSLENYDPIGRWRDTDGSTPIDPTGALTGTDVDGTYRGATELGARLASSATAQACAARVWFRYAFGRTETDQDACTVNLLAGALTGGAARSHDLLVQLVRTDAFRFRTVAP